MHRLKPSFFNDGFFFSSDPIKTTADYEPLYFPFSTVHTRKKVIS